MIKSSALALIGAMAVTSAAQIHTPDGLVLPPAETEPYVAPVVAADPSDPAAETLTVYYSPLRSTEVTRYVGFGLAYHMAIIYTDSVGHSYGVSSGPSDLKSPQTPRNAFDALLYMASDQPSSFGTLVSDPNNNTAFVKGHAGDYYTQDAQGHMYPHALVVRGKHLSAQWASIVRTYARIGKLGLTYSPMSQNSNSMAGTALRRAGIGLEFSSHAVFAPGTFTELPEG